MNFFSKSLLALLSILLFSFPVISAQIDDDNSVAGARKILINEKLGTISYVRLENPVFMNSEERLNWLKNEVCKLGSDYSFELTEETDDKFFNTHDYKYQEYYKGHPIKFGTYKIKTDNDTVISASGECYKNISIANMVLSRSSALENAKMFFGEKNITDETTENEKMYVVRNGNAYSLTHRYYLHSGTSKKNLIVYVDSNSGEIVLTESTEHHSHTPATSSATTLYSGTKTLNVTQLAPNSFILEDDDHATLVDDLHPRKFIITRNANNSTDRALLRNDASDIESDGSWPVAADGLDVHYGMQQAYNYFAETFGLYSFDGKGTPIESFVHYKNNHFNAGWDPVNQLFFFGDGNGLPLTSLDIVAHEYTHAVIQHSSNLFYGNESGALNESFADIFGVVIDFYSDHSNLPPANYFIAEHLGNDGPFRDMAHPENFNDPRCFEGVNWIPSVPNNQLDPSNDMGGVHINSSIQNLWFYLLVNGGETEQCDAADCPVNPIEGIGMDAAAKIAYGTMITLGENATFQQAMEFSLITVEELYATSSKCERSKILQQVTNAWFAVGVAGAPYEVEPELEVVSGNENGDCVGNPVSIKLTAKACGDIYWFANNFDTDVEDAIGEGETFYTPNISTTQSFYVEARNGCEKSERQMVEAKVNFVEGPLVQISASANSICKGSSVTLTASNAEGFTWRSAAGIEDNASAVQTVFPVVSTNYIVVGETADGCKSEANIFITVLDFAVVPQAVCLDATATLEAISFEGNPTFEWSPTTFLDATTGATVNSTPTTDIKYTVTGTFGNACSMEVAVDVSIIREIDVRVNSETICQGNFALLTASGADTYEWSTGETNSGIQVNPDVTTTYDVVGTNACASGNATATVFVIPTASVSISPDDVTICEGDADAGVELSGADVYEWKLLPEGHPMTGVDISELVPGVYEYEICGKNILVSSGNLIPNGDFSAGDNGFINDYDSYVKGMSNSMGNGLDDRMPGEDWVGPSFFDDWKMTADGDPAMDHTIPSTDNMMLSIDGLDTAPNVIWESAVPITLDPEINTYNFGFWAVSAEASSNPEFEVYFQIDGDPNWVLMSSDKLKLWDINYGPYDGPFTGTYGDAPSRWSEYCKFQWNANGASNVKVRIVDTKVDGLHDYMVDDIHLEGARICEGTCANLKLTVLDTPELDLVVSQGIICPGVNVTMTVSSDSDPGVTYFWEPGNETLKTITVSPSETTSYKVSGTLTETGCVGTANKAIQVIMEPITISICTEVIKGSTTHYNCTAATDKVDLCFGGTATLEASLQENWTWINLTTGLIVGTDQHLDVSPTETTQYQVRSTSCGWLEQDKTITVIVQQLPILSPLEDVAICSEEALDVRPTTQSIPSDFIWYAETNTEVDGESDGRQTQKTPIIDDQLTNKFTESKFVNYTVIPVSQIYGCNGSAGHFTARVNPVPEITNALSKTICNETNVGIDLATNDVASSFSWIAIENLKVEDETTITQSASLIDDLLINTSNVFQKVNYDVTPTSIAGGCVGDLKTIEVTVIPELIISSSSFLICSRDEIPQIEINNAAITANYTWTIKSNTGVTGAMANETVARATIDNDLTNTTTTNQTVVYTVTPIIGECQGDPVEITVTVRPEPQMIPNAFQEICSGAIFNMDLRTITNLPSTFAWMANDNILTTGESLTEQTTLIINNTLLSTSPINQVVNYNVIPTSLNGGCIGDPQLVSVTILAPPAMINASEGTICSGSRVGLLLETNREDDFEIRWRAISHPIVTGENTRGTTAVNPRINDLLRNTSNIPQKVTYTAIPVVVEQTGGFLCQFFNIGCPDPVVQCGEPVEQTITITVNPLPRLSSNLNPPAICSGATFTYAPTSAVSNTSFSWTRVAINGIEGSVGSRSGTGNITETLKNTTENNITVTYQIRANANNCTGPITNVRVVVYPSFKIEGAPQTICSGGAVDIKFKTNQASTFEWFANNNTTIEGESLTKQNSNTINNTLISISPFDEKVFYFVKGTPTNTGCPAVTQRLDVTVTAPPAMLNDDALTICSGDVVNLLLNTNMPDEDYEIEWKAINDNPLVTRVGAGSGKGANPTIDDQLINNTSAIQQVTYTATPVVIEREDPPWWCFLCPDPEPVVQCGSPVTQTITVSVVPYPTMDNDESLTICSGAPLDIVLKASIPSSFKWSVSVDSDDITGTSIGEQTDNTINDELVNTSSEPQTIIYTITPTPIGMDCEGESSEIAVTVNPLPLITVNSAEICEGQSVTLEAQGGDSYNWENGGTGDKQTFVPTESSSYLVKGTNAITGCVGEATALVTVNEIPLITVNSPTICSGESVQLNARGADSYLWNDGSTTEDIDVSPNITTSYVVTGTSDEGCSAIIETNVIVLHGPSLTVNNQTICEGESATLVVGGATTYLWETGETSSIIFVGPPSTRTYQVIGFTVGGCNSTAEVTVSVKPLPILTISDDAEICEGGSITLIAEGATSYEWSPPAGLSSTIGSAVIATPIETTAYEVAGSSDGCTSTAEVTVSVKPLPILMISDDAEICEGESATLIAEGATSYEWSPPTGLNSSTASSVIATPTETTTYEVTGSTDGCTSTAEVTVSVKPLPILTISDDEEICEGGSITLIAEGATSYEWSPPAGLSSTIGSTVIATPIETTAYEVAGSSDGCTSTAEVTVSVKPLPILTISDDAEICEGESATLIAQGATSYEWSPPAGLSSTIGSTVIASPTETTTYEVTGSSEGCNNTAEVTVTVFPFTYGPEHTVNGDIEMGDETDFLNTALYDGVQANNYGGYHLYCVHTENRPGLADIDAIRWENTTPIAVVPNANYLFSLDEWTWGGDSQEDKIFEIYINGILVHSFNVIPTDLRTFTSQEDADVTPEKFTNHSMLWNSGSNTSATISIRIYDMPGGRFPFTGDRTYLDNISLKPRLCNGIYKSEIMAEIGDEDNSIDFETPFGKEEIILFPNPNNGIMTLNYSFNSSDRGVMEIYDVLGQMVDRYLLDGNANQLTINIANIINGTYFYRILLNDVEVKNDKIIVIR